MQVRLSNLTLGDKSVSACPALDARAAARGLPNDCAMLLYDVHDAAARCNRRARVPRGG